MGTGDRFDNFLVAAGGITGLDRVSFLFDGAASGTGLEVVDATGGALSLVATSAAPVDEPAPSALLVAGLPLAGFLARGRRGNGRRP
jgi:hypothetical protein